MAEKDGLTELAMMLKARDNSTPLSMTTGIVEAIPPEPLIRLNDVIVLDKTMLKFASNLVGGYERKIKFIDENCGITTSAGDPSHTHDIAILSVDTLMQWTDTLQVGDEVILQPVMDGQLYFCIDKAVSFE